MLEIMDKKEILALVNTVVAARRDKELTRQEKDLVLGAWSGETYEQIAEKNGKSVGYMRIQASKIWDLLSEEMEELGEKQKINKKNFRVVFGRKAKDIFQKRENSLLIESNSSLKMLVTNSVSIFNDSNCYSAENSVNLLKGDSQSLSSNVLESPSGPLAIGSRFYVERPPLELSCCQEILQPRALIRVKAAKQMGKTSLLNKILNFSNQQAYNTLYLDLNLANFKNLTNSEKFLKWFAATVGYELGQLNKIDEYWDELLGGKMSCDSYFKNCLLKELERPLVLAIDNIDALFERDDLGEEFLQLLRSWHQQGSSKSELLSKLRLILAYSTEADQIPDINQSPFNIGIGYTLPEFTVSQVQELVESHSLPWSNSEIEALMKLLGGHPYLIRLALYELAEKDEELSTFLQTAPTVEGLYSNHLRRHLRSLEKQENLLLAWKKVLETDSPVELPELERFKLDSMGLIHLKEQRATIRCQLYRQYFQTNLSD